jgi:anthranilate phosphoribosyltransferase
MAKGKKNEVAQALVARRWKKTTKEERSTVARTMNESRWANATPEERAALGQRLAAARAKARKQKRSEVAG